MILKNGKFYDSAGQVVPPEFGNKEQIKLIQEEENRIACFKGEGLPVSIDIDERVVYDFQIRFHCVCGKLLYRDHESDESDDIDTLLKKKVTCPECKRKYAFEPDQDDPEGALVFFAK
jgi:rubredoxin